MMLQITFIMRTEKEQLLVFHTGTKQPRNRQVNSHPKIRTKHEANFKDEKIRLPTKHAS